MTLPFRLIFFLKNNFEIIFSILLRVVSSFLLFLIFYITAKKLSIESFGNFQFFITLITVLSLTLSLGVDQKIFKESVKLIREKKNTIDTIILSSIVHFFIIISIFVVVILCIVNIFQLNNYTNLNLYFILVLFVSVALNIFNSFLFQYLRAIGKNKLFIFTSGLFQNLILIILILFFIDFNLNQLIFFYFLTILINFFLLILINKNLIKYGKISTKKFKNICLESNNFFKFKILSTINGTLDIWFIAIFANDILLGFYIFALRFASIPRLFHTASANYYLPKLLDLFNQNKNRKLINLYHKSTFSLYLLVFFPIIVFLIFTTSIVELISDKYYESINIIRVILIAQLVNLVTGPNGLLFSYTKYINWLFNKLLLCSCFYILFMFIGYKFFGLIGIAYAYFIYVTLFNIFLSIKFYKIFKVIPIIKIIKNNV
jgi:O-antigen/teichoic acid export membrane protein